MMYTFLGAGLAWARAGNVSGELKGTPGFALTLTSAAHATARLATPER